jgi:predicted AAA+ superfamily ATPase
MTFAEYLLALGEDRLLERLDEWRVGGTLSPAVHERATALFARYSMVGGMPRVVAADVAGNDPRECRRLQHDLVATYRDDFTKYTGRMDARILDMVLLAVAAQLGRKFIYARVSEGVKQHQAKHSLDLLDKARLCHIVRWSAANGIPLGGEVKDSFRKIILLDVGLLHSLLGTPAYSSFPKWEILSSQVRGQLLEQITGQQLHALAADPSDEPRLYYWQREGGRPGEIDFLIQVHHHIVPVELKAGAAGAMKSLHQFMYDKRLGLAVRLDSNPPSAQDLDLKTTQSDRVLYRLISLPHYLAWNIEAIIIDHIS